jgi:hypothetical protein
MPYAVPSPAPAPYAYGPPPAMGGYPLYGAEPLYSTAGTAAGPPNEAPGVQGTSYKVPRGARYIGAEREMRDGKEVTIDRYAVPQRHVQQVEKLIEETKQVQVMEPRVVPETRTISVPMQRMVPEQYTVMVPRVKMVPVREMVPQVMTRMVPQQFMAPKNITVEKTIQVPRVQHVKVNWVRPGVVVHESQQVLEYERPRLIPGKFRGVTTTQSQPKGMQWGGMYPISDEQARYLQTQGSMSRQYDNGYNFEDGPDYGYGGGDDGYYGGRPQDGSSAPNQPRTYDDDFGR